MRSTILVAALAAAIASAACSEAPLNPTGATRLPHGDGLRPTLNLTDGEGIQCSSQAPTLSANTNSGGGVEFTFSAVENAEFYTFEIDRYLPDNTWSRVAEVVDLDAPYAQWSTEGGGRYRVRVHARRCGTFGDYSQWVLFSFDESNDPPLVVVPPIPPVIDPEYPLPPLECPEGYHVAGDVCIPDVVDPPPPVVCPEGQHNENGSCVDDEVTPPPPPPPPPVTSTWNRTSGYPGQAEGAQNQCSQVDGTFEIGVAPTHPHFHCTSATKPNGPWSAE